MMEQEQDAAAPSVKELAARAEYIAGLRALATWLEENPKVEIPFGDFAVYATDTKENAAETLRAMGKAKKIYSNSTFQLQKQFNSQVYISYCFLRETVCEKRVVGKKWVEDNYVPATFVAAHEEEVVEWDCKPLLKEDESAPPEAAATDDDIPL